MDKARITLKDKLGVFFWRNILIPFIERIGGQKYPNDIDVVEYSYGEHEKEKLDYIAVKNKNLKQTAVIHIHGGGWVAGSKGNFYSRPLSKFANDGYPVFSINYPLAPEVQHPYLLRSLLKALIWIKSNFPQYNSIHLIGDSAGGNLAMMLGIYLSNPELLILIDNTEQDEFPVIKSIVDIFGVNDKETWVDDRFSSAKLFNKVYSDNHEIPEIPQFPMDFSNIERLPPLFIVGAGKDKLLRSSIIWAEHISKSFKDVTFKIYEGSDHGFFSFGKGCEELSDDMVVFFRKH